MPPGQCRKIADPGSGYASGYNRTTVYQRVWEYTWEDPGDGTRCGGASQLIAPGQAIPDFAILPARGLGGR